jgi:hypothetical protein
MKVATAPALLALALAAGLLAACWPGLESLEPFPCGTSDSQCPEGYQCRQGTCYRAACENSGPCPDGYTCTALTSGETQCDQACSAPLKGCTLSTDCKLVLADDHVHTVAACTAFGTALQGGTCDHVTDCGLGLACYSGSSASGRCVPLCSPTVPCAEGTCQTDPDAPAGWGYCD